MKYGKMHHVGLAVSDLDRSIAFYSRFGFDLHDRFELESTGAGTGVPGPLAIAHLYRGDEPILELIEYGNRGRATVPANNDVGAPHVAFEVDDIFGMYEELSAEGIEFYSPPNPQYIHGCHWLFMKDPDGIAVELIQPNSAPIRREEIEREAALTARARAEQSPSRSTRLRHGA